MSETTRLPCPTTRRLTSRAISRWGVQVGVLATVAILLLTSIALPAPYRTLSPASAGPPPPVSHTPRTPIQHVIIVIQENHAFDNYFTGYPGAFTTPAGGILQPTTQDNVTSYANEYNTDWSYTGNQSFSDPEHMETSIRGEQDNGSMDGFDYINGAVPNSLMPSYIVANELGLAQQYSVADNYYTDFAGPTLPNRFYYYATTSGPVTGDNNPPGDSVSFPSLPQELTTQGISWASYDGNYNEEPDAPCDYISYFPTCPSWYFSFPTSSDQLSQLSPMLYFNWIQNEYNNTGNVNQVQPYSNIYTNLTDGTLPSVSWFTSDWTCCTEHPSDASFSFIGGNVTEGMQSTLQLVHAVEDSPYWNNTAIFLTYDEGGGFFDSSPSPLATPVGTGLRVPLVVISPYTKEGFVSHTFLTPSSLLHFVEWNWGIPSLGWLDADSNLPLDMFNFNATPRAALPQTVYGSSNLTGAWPWTYTQPVAANLTGTYEPELVTNREVNWSYQTNNVLLSAPSISGSVLYTCGLDEALRAFEPITGALLWSDPLGSACRASPTPLPGGGAVVTTLLGSVQAFGSGGTHLWNDSFGAPLYGNLTPVGTDLYGALQNGSLFAVSAATGAVLWEKQVSADPFYAAPVYDAADHLFLLSASGAGVLAVNLTGVPQWTAAIPGGTYAQGAICGSTFYVTSPGGGLYPVSLPTGSVGTPAQLNYSVATPLCVGTNSLFVGDNSTFRAFTLSPFAQTWSHITHSEAAGAPVALGEDVAVDTEGGRYYVFPQDSSTPLTLLSSGTSFFGSILSAPSGQYFTAEDGNLYARLSGGEIRLTVSPANASVTLSGSPISLTAGGTTLLEAPGSYVVSASSPGLATGYLTVPVTQGRITWANLTLSPPSGAPTIGSFTAAPTSLILGNATTLTVLASGGTTPYTYTYTNLPAGCATANTSTLTCTSTATGIFSPLVTVSDPSGKSTQATTTFTVNPPTTSGLSVTSFTASPNPIALGASTTFQTVASGGTAPYTYAYGGLPSGCSSSSVPSLSCAPTVSGNYSVVVTVTDSASHTATGAVDLDVIAPVGYPTIRSFTAQPSDFALGASTDLTVSATGGTPPYAYRYSDLPAGCTSANSSSISCTPARAGQFNVSVTVTDVLGHSVGASTQLVVTSAPPSVLSLSFVISPNPIVFGNSTNLEAVVSGGVAPYTYTYSGLPAGCFSSNASAVSCTPTESGNFSIEVAVSDRSGLENQSTQTLEVKPAPPHGSSATPTTSALTLAIVVILAVAAAVIVAILLLVRRKRSSPDPPPPPSSAEPAPDWQEQSSPEEASPPPSGGDK